MSAPPRPPSSSLIRWLSNNYAEPLTFIQHAIRFVYVVLVFCAAFLLGLLKGLLVGPVAAVLLIFGNIAVILGLFPAHVAWTVYSIFKSKSLNAALKVACLLALPALFGLWLVLSICGSIVVGLGYGFFAPWVATFDAFRQSSEKKKFFHCLVDGTWGTLQGSCTVVRDFTDICYHSIPEYLKEFRESPNDSQLYSIRLPYMKWAQERSFKRGVAYVVAMVSEFDEYTNDCLYLREGSFLPKPKYRKKKEPHSAELSRRASSIREAKGSSGYLGAPAMLVPRLAPSKTVREAIQEVTMLQIWGDLMKSCEQRGKELVDANIITKSDLYEWLKTNGNNQEIVGLGLPSYALLQDLLSAVKSGSDGLLLSNGVEVTHVNHPQNRLLGWFFTPVMVLKDQLMAIKLGEDEVKYLENQVLLVGNKPSTEAQHVVPQDTVRTAQIQALSRRLVGVTRSISKLPTYRRRYGHVVKMLMTYALEREAPSGSHSTRSVATIEIMPVEV